MRIGAILVAIGACACSSSGGDDAIIDDGQGTGGTVASDGGKAGAAGTAGTDAGKAGAAGSGGAKTGSGGALGSGGASSGAGGSSTGSGGSEEAGGTAWYDGETGSMPLSSGQTSVSSGSTATEIPTDCHGGADCLSVSLDGSGGWGHLGWTPSKNWTVTDLSKYSTLEYWIRGDSTGVKMELHGPSGGCPWVVLNDHLPGGATATWQKVSIPLSAFGVSGGAHTIDWWLDTSGRASFAIDDGKWR